jgi:PEP-CTERM motif
VRDLDGGRVGGPRHGRRGHDPRQVRSKWLALLLVVAAAVVAWQFARRQTSSDLFYSPSRKAVGSLPRTQRDDDAPHARQSASKPLAYGIHRLVYPYSVVRGGVANPDELKHAMEYDPVVLRHFRGFDYERAHLVRLSEKQSMYVSYRIGDRVYWTRRKVTLPLGETLITDGNISVRTRCGNRVAAVPLDAGSPLEPSPDDLEQPFITRDPDPIPPVLAAENSAPIQPASPAVIPAAAKSGGWWFIPPLVYVPSGSSGSSGGPLAVTPEPGSLLLITSGLAAVYWRTRKARRKK